MSAKIDFLAQLPIFRNLNEEQLATLATICREYQFEAEAVLAYQRDVADSLFIVRSGRLFASGVDGQGIVRNSRSYLAGDYFHEAWLFTSQAHPATVRAKSPGRVILIKNSDFLKLVQKRRDILTALEPIFDENDQWESGLTEAAWHEAIKTPAAVSGRPRGIRLMPEELLEFATRRSRWLILLRLLLPTLFFIGSFIAFLVLQTIGLTPWNWLMILPLVLALLWILYVWLDWRNDHFYITNRRIIHTEFSLNPAHFGSSASQIPVDKIQSVEILKPNLFSNLFNVGSARVTTASREVMLFDFIDTPLAVRDSLNQISQQVRALDAGRTQAAMRESVEGHFQLKNPLTNAQPDEEEEETSGNAPAGDDFLTRFRRNFAARLEEGNMVTYRKHWLVLLWALRYPTLIFTLLIIGSWAVTNFLALPFSTVIPFLAVGLFLNLLFFIWQLEDWRNDLYQLTDRQIIDIDRRPFGFSESRKQADLSNVQNTRADQPGLLPFLFNYGDVHVETAGTSANIVFEHVVDPNRVQSDLLTRLDQFRQQQRIQEGVQRRREYAVLLDVYKQAVEQQRIPQRTPPPELGSDF